MKNTKAYYTKLYITRKKILLCCAVTSFDALLAFPI